MRRSGLASLDGNGETRMAAEAITGLADEVLWELLPTEVKWTRECHRTLEPLWVTSSTAPQVYRRVTGGLCGVWYRELASGILSFKDIPARTVLTHPPTLHEWVTLHLLAFTGLVLVPGLVCPDSTA